MRDCPKRSKLNALMRESDSEESDETRSANPIQMLSALVVDKAPNGTKGLMYASVLINGKEVKAMVDSGATHNFVAEREVKKLGLTLSKHASQVKAVNSEAGPVKGRTDVDLVIGSWKGQCGLTAVPLDDFDVILGQEFLLAAKAAVIPFLGGLMIMDEERPCFVECLYVTKAKAGKKPVARLAAVQLEAESNDEESSSLIAVVGTKTVNSRAGLLVRALPRNESRAEGKLRYSFGLMNGRCGLTFVPSCCRAWHNSWVRNVVFSEFLWHVGFFVGWFLLWMKWKPCLGDFRGLVISFLDRCGNRDKMLVVPKASIFTCGWVLPFERGWRSFFRGLKEHVGCSWDQTWELGFDVVLVLKHNRKRWQDKWKRGTDEADGVGSTRASNTVGGGGLLPP
ncbi:PREDICTED: uncharacterized protein LOC105971552 isoform X2 [Erythranthe guttata]|uniref:uncharacterized protein LOC105971552 isoform X1 n=1 Tax=Erythranthe guttata TaxID=4155 RepID=UPI00064DF79E|nr:PREDICTED: uncharacterized protein LOC105971552 isoform X1 [Erythranthe guttata]XP_012851859.1 PREDICTED: uncharacterized protein LOC105971552 isoform X2 [Erythranthe guttata]|eukprot:XP_012851858.1 PREDICTED: uncharacterized protein LOC105971552 isoform X1 [Erythranthe guttata]